jgi:glycosyltransferase involved in cell wall biosynthesis
VYAAGPGDVMGTYHHWTEGRDDPTVPDVAYSRQFFDVCHAFGARAWVIAAHREAKVLDDGAFRIEHRPIPWDGKGGLRFHVGRHLYGLGFVRSALAYRADVVIAAHGIPWHVLSWIARTGRQVVPAVHNTLWLKSKPPGHTDRVLLRMGRSLFATRSFAILSHPGVCAEQVRTVAAGQCRPIVPFISFYRRSTFSNLPDKGEKRPPFRVLFAGRVEAEKGVFDLLEVGRQLRHEGRSDIEFDVCGTGSALKELQQGAQASGLATHFRCHGWLPHEAYRAMFARSHVVVVPTRRDYTEGFNAVIVEAILAGRPVIASRVCPSLDLVEAAALGVTAEDVAGYKSALLALCDDPRLYEAKRQATLPLREQFYDPERSWGAGLQRILSALQQGREVEPGPGLSGASAADSHGPTVGV